MESGPRPLIGLMQFHRFGSRDRAARSMHKVPRHATRRVPGRSRRARPERRRLSLQHHPRPSRGHRRRWRHAGERRQRDHGYGRQREQRRRGRRRRRAAGGACERPQLYRQGGPGLDGHHNPGQACLGCHDGNTAGANKFTAAGTVYDKLSLAAGAQGLAGVTIEITDAAGTKLAVVTASQGAAGNFWTDQPLVFPLQVRASQCPADRPMADPLADNANNAAAGGGNCSRVGCHDSNMILHVP